MTDELIRTDQAMARASEALAEIARIITEGQRNSPSLQSVVEWAWEQQQIARGELARVLARFAPKYVPALAIYPDQERWTVAETEGGG